MLQYNKDREENHMALQATRYCTVEEFDQFVFLPENIDKTFEYIGGEIIEVVSNNYSSYIAARLLGELYAYLKTHPIGHITGADGGYMIEGERYIPDVAFISMQKQPQPSRAAYNPIPPDLAVEVLSPGNTDREIRIKVANYLKAAVLLWVVDPDQKRVEVYQSGKAVQIAMINDTLIGADVLPGFTLTGKDIFPVEDVE
jgi:Uma2 family endonuclease